MSGAAPGCPGIPPRWTSSAKSGIGTALDARSRLWFSLSHGIINEVYFPRLDQACIRDLGMIVTDGSQFFSEEKRDTGSQLAWLAPGAPAFHLRNTCNRARYRIEKQILSDPQRCVLLQKTQLIPMMGELRDHRLFVLLAPHLGNWGMGNTAWIGEYKSVPMLFAEREGHALALASSAPWRGRSAGFVGYSDGWQDLSEHKRMEWEYERAEDGNVALTGEIDLSGSDSFVLALGFGENWAEAAQAAQGSLLDGFEAARSQYLQGWREWQEELERLDRPADVGDLYRPSTAVLRAHESSLFSGGIIASLSIPWGFHKGDDDLGGYHLVWPRDLVEAAGGLLAAGAKEDARRVLRYLELTQEADGHWPQNMWLDGLPYWTGVQMDETAFPILLVNLLHRYRALPEQEVAHYWPLVRRAASFLVRNGPVTGQDRWEEDAGFSPFTLAVEIAALLVAAEMAELIGEVKIGRYLRETADCWNSSVERWTYAEGTELARQCGVPGYYMRIAPPEGAGATSPFAGFVPIKNRPPMEAMQRADHVVSTDFLALVRFGLRAADDSRIRATLKVVDATLKIELPQGPLWHRYDGDGYGEHEDGAPFDGTGIGRAWPLLAGERAHYELAAGNRSEAQRLLQSVQASADPGGLLPEQTWDSPDIPQRELFLGRPSGSARPLVWAHAEYLKLVRSLRDGAVFDQPPQTRERYALGKTGCDIALWSLNNKSALLPRGKRLRISLPEAAVVHWSLDGWRSAHDTETSPSGLSTHLAELATERLSIADTIVFTFRWQADGRWEGADYRVSVVDGREP